MNKTVNVAIAANHRLIDYGALSVCPASFIHRCFNGVLGFGAVPGQRGVDGVICIAPSA